MKIKRNLSRFITQVSVVLGTILYLTPGSVAQDSDLASECPRQEIGERCSIIFQLDAGKAQSTKDERYEVEQGQVFDGYAVVGWKEENESSNGGTFHVENITRNSNVEIERASGSSNKKLREFESRLDALVQASINTPVGSLGGPEVRANLEGLRRELEELKVAFYYTSKTKSNIDVFILKATSRYICQIPFILGNCLKGYGSHGKGYVKVDLVYVGDPVSSADKFSSQLSLLEKGYDDSTKSKPVQIVPQKKEGVGTYIVKPGDTLLSIAKRHNTGWRKLLALNPKIKSPNLIKPNDVINVPQEKEDVGSYIVKSGDTLLSIAKRHNIGWRKLLALNPKIKSPNLIKPNDVINVPLVSD